MFTIIVLIIIIYVYHESGPKVMKLRSLVKWKKLPLPEPDFDFSALTFLDQGHGKIMSFTK